jgi:hypothetical protein
MRLQQIARPLIGALVIAAFGLPIAVQAQPSYARHDEAIHGRITSFDGHYQLLVRDERGYSDRVALRDGTVIHPVGLRLAPGMSVTIRGHNDGATFTAFEIDAPYNVAPTYAPAYAPYPAPYVYPAYPEYPPYYPPYVYPNYRYYPSYYYGSSFSLSIGFGGPGYYGHIRFRGR